MVIEMTIFEVCPKCGKRASKYESGNIHCIECGYFGE